MRTVISGRESIRYIRNRMPFKTSTRNFTGSGTYDHYCIYSYSTLIAEFSHGVWYFNDTSYSITTSKHQGFIRQALEWDTMNDKGIHFYHLNMYVSSLCDRPLPTVATERVARIRREYAYA